MITLLAVIFVFGLLIIGHEFGHFIVAKLSGIKVNEFSFGMGPRILKFGSGETEYSWRAFPIGGFVKMLGEEEQVDDPRSFSTKPTINKMAVIAAGPVMNVVISIIIFAVIAMTSGYAKPVIDKFAEVKTSQDTVIYPAKEAGLQAGDRIAKANDKKIGTYSDFLMVMLKNGSNPVKLDIVRQGKHIPITVNPVYDKEQNKYIIGIYPVWGRAGIIEGIQYGVSNSWTLAREIGGFLKSLVMGKASTEDVSGPVGIIKYTGEAAKEGFGSLLVFTAFLSINLAFMNLIPFPALDGGWLLLLLIEGVRRKKLDADKVGILNFIGFAFLMVITVLVTFRDVLRLNWF